MSISSIAPIGGVNATSLIKFIPVSKQVLPLNQNISHKIKQGITNNQLPEILSSNPLSWQIDSFHSIFNFLVNNNHQTPKITGRTSDIHPSMLEVSSLSRESIRVSEHQKISRDVSQKDSISIEEKKCHLCQTRRYVCSNGETSDGNETIITGKQSALRVQQHEAEHLQSARNKALQEDRVVIGQEIKLCTTVCPECGETYTNKGIASSKSISRNEFKALISSVTKVSDKDPLSVASRENNTAINPYLRTLPANERLEGKGVTVDLYI